MPLAYDELILREPRLLIPRTQPTVPTRVDEANPLATGLYWLYMPWTANRRRLIVGKNNDTLATLSLAPTGPTGGSSDALPELNGGIAEMFASSGWLAFSTPLSAGVHPFTIGVVAVTTQLGATQTLYSWGNTGASNNYGRLEIGTTGVIGAVERNTTTYRASTPNAVAVDKPFAAMAKFESSTSRYAALDGVVSAQDTGSADATNANARFGNTALSGGSAPLLGGLYFACFWTRGLSDQEMVSWTNDPYQILTPA